MDLEKNTKALPLPHLSGSLQLGSSFYFSFEEPTLADKSGMSQASAEILGWELTQGSLKFRALDTLLPRNNVHIIPVPNSLQACFLVRTLLDHLTKNAIPLGSVHVDWLPEVAPLIPRLLKSEPAPIAAAPVDLLSAGRARAHHLPLASHRETLPVLFWESLEPRRYFLSEMSARGLLSPEHGIFPYGGAGSLVADRLLHEQRWPGELLIASGLLPWLEGWLTEPAQQEPSTPKVCPVLLLRAAAQDSEKIHIVLASASALLALAQALEQVPAVQGSPVMGIKSLEEARHTARMQSDKLRLCALPSQTCLEFSQSPGFVAHSFFADAVASHSPRAKTQWIAFLQSSLTSQFLKTADRYQEWTRQSISHAQSRDYFRFLYKLAADEGRLFPTTFEMLLAGQAIVDANFSFEFLKDCVDYPHHTDTEQQYPFLDISLKDITGSVESFSIARFETLQQHRFVKPKLKSLEQRKQETKERSVKSASGISEEKYADNSWVNEDHPYSCSFPEEDIFMEDFAFQYRDQAREMLRARETVTREMDTSFCEGLDIRATVRNWHLQKIMIKEELNIGRADIGAIVFQFAEPGLDSKYSWNSYWLAEQHDKSDLMFYATPFKDNVIGPGIAKSEFGGFAVIPLPNYLDNPWLNPFIRHFAKSPSDALVLAAALATDHRTILHIGNHTVSSDIQKLLKRSGKNIVRMKLDELPPDKIRKLRTFHILAEAGIREYAAKYIRKD